MRYVGLVVIVVFFFFFKQKTAYEMRISDWSSDVCSSDLLAIGVVGHVARREYAGDGGGGRARFGQQVAVGIERQLALEQFGRGGEIGRASCRERVCQYV